MATSIARPDDFKIVIEHSGAVPAADIGAMLLGLDKAFSRFVRRKSSGGRYGKLGVREVRHGSIEIVLEAIDTLLDTGKYLAPFASHIVEVAKSALEIVGLPTGTKADQKLVADIANPVANGRAQQINLVIHGNPTFVFTPELAADMIERLTPSPKQALARPSRPPLLDEQQRHLLMDAGLMGTAFQVDDEWYARLEDGHGVLVPIFDLGGTTLTHRGLYRFRGYAVRGNHGETVGINITGANLLDGSQPNGQNI